MRFATLLQSNIHGYFIKTKSILWKWRILSTACSHSSKKKKKSAIEVSGRSQRKEVTGIARILMEENKSGRGRRGVATGGGNADEICVETQTARGL